MLDILSLKYLVKYYKVRAHFFKFLDLILSTTLYKYMIPTTHTNNQSPYTPIPTHTAQGYHPTPPDNILRPSLLTGSEQLKIKQELQRDIKQELQRDMQDQKEIVENSLQKVKPQIINVQNEGQQGVPKRKRNRSMKERKVRTIITKEKLLKMNEVFTQYVKEKTKNNGEAWTLKKIASELGLGYSTILHKYREFRANKKVKAGTLIASRQRKRKYKKSLLVEEYIQKSLQEQQFFTASQMTYFIEQKYGITFSRSIISRHLGQMGYSYKNVSHSVRAVKPHARYEAVRKNYAQLMLPLIEKNETLIFADELSCCFSNGPDNQNNIVSVLLACTIHGVLFFHIQEGFFHRQQFYEIIKKFFGNLKESSFCQNIQGEDGELYLVLDLNKIHRDDAEGKPGLAQMLVEENIELYYIPPGANDLNPIEPIFQKIKQLMREKVSNNEIKSLKQSWEELQKIMDQIQHESTELYFMEMYDRLQSLKQSGKKK